MTLREGGSRPRPSVHAASVTATLTAESCSRLEKQKFGEVLVARLGEMLQAQRMKLHIGVDSKAVLAHILV